MKRIMVVLAVVLGIMMAAQAQEPKALPAAAAPAMKTIFDYQEEIGLSDKQVADIKALMQGLQTTLSAKAKDLMQMRQALGEMVKNKEDMKAIRKQLQKIADLQVDNSCLDIETSRKVEMILTADQLAKWKEMQMKTREEAIAQAQKAAAEKAAKAGKK